MRKKTVKTIMIGLTAVALLTKTSVYAQSATSTESRQDAFELSPREQIKALETKKKNMEQELSAYPNAEEFVLAYEKLCDDIIEMKEYMKILNTTKKNDKDTDLTAGLATALSSSDLYRESINLLYESDKDIVDKTFYGYYNVDETRVKTVNTAIASQGRIKYEWGGKPMSSEWQQSWDEKTKGLDCSGFVSFVCWNVTGEHNEGLDSTYAIAHELTKINEDELQPGDIGMLNSRGTYYSVGSAEFSFYDQALAYKESTGNTNKIRTHVGHTGIYVGKDANGNKLWCHCKGGNVKTVVVDNFNFKHYYRVF